MAHVVLLGDSSFDNDRYVPGGPSVIEHLRKCLPGGWRATLLAVDGSIASDVADQLARLPADATHLVVSAGGNNALECSSLILNETAGSFQEVLDRMGDIREDFQKEYRVMLDAVLARGKPVTACTVYDSIPTLGRVERTGLALFNEVIQREAARALVDLIDLRLVCTEATDYASTSPIEPSVSGGGKIARVVAAAVTGPAGRGSRVIVG